MNEADIANRASHLRQQAICRLNGTECKEFIAANPSSQSCQQKNKLYVLPNTDYQSLIVVLAAYLVILNGYSLYVSNEQRGYLLTATSSRCISDVTIQRSGGKHPATYFNDAKGQKVASCLQYRCSYKDSNSDVGKMAKICLSGDVVVSIETEGKLKVTRSSLIAELDRSIWWSKFWLGLCGLYLIALVFRRLEKWKELIRSRFA